MTRPQTIHHINFLFEDLQAAVQRFSALLGDCEFLYEDLPQRGVRTARTQVGETWFVLVSPVDPLADTVPAKHLRERGEGFFLLSLGVADLEQTLGALNLPATVRRGLNDWRIADLPTDLTLDVPMQFTELPSGSGD